jgi:hypothetical protein
LVLTLSAVVLLAAVVLLLVRFAGLRAWHALACTLLGFFLASSSLAPYIHDATRAVARVLAGLDQQTAPDARTATRHPRPHRPAIHLCGRPSQGCSLTPPPTERRPRPIDDH